MVRSWFPERPIDPQNISKLKIAIPGKLTSAFLALRIFNADFEYEVVPFDKIIDAVQSGRCDAGLLIHEGQLFYESIGVAQDSGPGRMVAPDDRTAIADGRQCDSA